MCLLQHDAFHCTGTTILSKFIKAALGARGLGTFVLKDRVHLPHGAVEMSGVWVADPGVSGQRALSPQVVRGSRKVAQMAANRRP